MSRLTKKEFLDWVKKNHDTEVYNSVFNILDNITITQEYRLWEALNKALAIRQKQIHGKNSGHLERFNSTLT